MAKVNFNNLDEAEQNTTAGAAGSDIGFFTLKNDNDEAVVRFMFDSVDDFEILTVHDIQLGQRYRKVNCIRDPREPLEMCPLCASGAKISNRFFIKMIQYNSVPDQATGGIKIVPQAVVWERSTQYAKTLKSYLDNYGPLSDIICKVIRHGKAGDMQTTYEIVPNLSKSVFRDDVYVKDPSLFGTFDAFGTIVMDRNADEMRHFLATGEFPTRQTQQTPAVNNTVQNVNTTAEISPRTYDQPAVQTSAYIQPTPAVTTVQTPVPQQTCTVVNNTVGSTPTAEATPVQPQRVAWDANSTQNVGFDRPRRY